jgi:hypothetical protein
MKFVSGSLKFVTAGFEISISNSEIFNMKNHSVMGIILNNNGHNVLLEFSRKEEKNYLSVSKYPVRDKILKMKANGTDQLTKDTRSCKLPSICLDESTDVTLTARLATYCLIL